MASHDDLPRRNLSHFIGRQRRHLLAVIAAVAILAGAVGCSSSETVAPVGSPTGNWTGSVSQLGTVTTLSIVLLEKTGSMTGNGTITIGTSPFAVNVSGTFVSPTLSVTISAQGFNSMNFTGKLSENSLNGVLNGSGFANQSLTLARQ